MTAHDAAPGGSWDHSGLASLSKGAAAVAAVTGVGGALYLLGAFGPVSCVTSTRSEASIPGEVSVTHDCTAGIDYLFGAGGNAPVLFFWALVLLGIVAVGAPSAWTGRRHVTWATTGVGAIVTVIGVFSVGWFFLVPTIALLTAAIARSVQASRAKTD